MESEWVRYLRTTRPDLYEQMKTDTNWNVEWRDKEIARLQSIESAARKWDALRENPYVMPVVAAILAGEGPKEP